MEKLEELLDRLNADHTRKTEKQFEKELTSQILYYYDGFELDLEDDSYIPVFTSEHEAKLLGVSDSRLYAALINDIPNDNGFDYVINPMNQAIIFDQSIWSIGSFEVLGANATELLFMMKSKELLASYSIREATLINVKDNGKVYTALVLSGIPEGNQENDLITKLQAMFEGTSIREVFSTDDSHVALMIKGLKPYYKGIR